MRGALGVIPACVSVAETRLGVSAAKSATSGSSGGRVMLTTIPPTGSAASSNSATPSVVSWTGISSSSVTRWTAVLSDLRTAMTPSAWLRMGPTFATPAISVLTLRNRVIRPVGGASRTMAS